MVRLFILDTNLANFVVDWFAHNVK